MISPSSTSIRCLSSVGTTGLAHPLLSAVKYDGHMNPIYRAPLIPSYSPRPIAPGNVPAGVPSSTQEYEEATLDINDYLIDEPPPVFTLFFLGSI